MNNTSKPSASTGTADVWRVRTEDGTIFGPASLDTLRGWARAGRLAPGHTVSSNGRDWQSAARMPQLEMDWVVEVSSGAFYGPIHREALDELIREGSVASDAARFARGGGDGNDREKALRAEHSAALVQIETLRGKFTSHTVELEQQARQLTDECAKLKGQIETRDMEFDAERQELRAAVARHQADLAKSDKARDDLARQMAQVKRHEQEFAAARARLAELEALQTSFTARQQAIEVRLEEALQAASIAEKALRAERGERERLVGEGRQAAEDLKSMRLRHDSLRKLLEQALTMLETPGATPGGGTVIEDGVTVETDAEPPRPGNQPARKQPILSQLETQAQQELERLGRRKNPLFGRMKATP